MIVAVTHDAGNVFQHFGKSEQFKMYVCDDGKVLSSEVVDNGGLGHGALAGLLSERNVGVLICGGIGPGAVSALSERGITVCAGASGSCDEAVASFLRGELDCSASPNCDHHSHDGGHAEGSGGGCGCSCH